MFNLLFLVPESLITFNLQLLVHFKNLNDIIDHFQTIQHLSLRVRGSEYLGESAGGSRHRNICRGP